jgi:hypothetical protein
MSVNRDYDKECRKMLQVMEKIRMSKYFHGDLPSFGICFQYAGIDSQDLYPDAAIKMYQMSKGNKDIHNYLAGLCSFTAPYVKKQTDATIAVPADNNLAYLDDLYPADGFDIALQVLQEDFEQDETYTVPGIVAFLREYLKESLENMEAAEDRPSALTMNAEFKDAVSLMMALTLMPSVCNLEKQIGRKI